MKLTSKGKQEVKEVPWGVYLWKMPDGSFVSDGDGNFLMISSTEGDQTRLRALADAARACGVTSGAPCYFSGNRIVSDEEYEHQKMRMKAGLTPDPFDIAAIKEAERFANKRR